MIWVDTSGGVSWITGSGGSVGVPGTVSCGGAWLVDTGGLVSVNAGVSNWWGNELHGGSSSDKSSDYEGSEHFDLINYYFIVNLSKN